MLRLNAALPAAVLSFALALGAGAAVCAPAAGPDPISAAAETLTAGAFADLSCFLSKRLTAGVWPFEDDKVPVSAKAAERLYQEILSRLLAQKPKCIDYLDGSSIGTILTYLNRTGALQKSGGSPIAALEAANQAVDIVVFPSLYSQGGRIVLSLKAVERVSGKTLAQTPPVQVPDELIVGDIADQAVSLDAAVSRAAHQFARQIGDLNEIRTAGIFYEDTGAQPGAGRYLMERLTTALTEELANPITNRVLKITEATIDPGAKPGAKVDPEKLGGAVPAVDPAYLMTGRYWLRGDAVELKISLRRGDGATFAWQGRIRRADLKDLQLRPTNAAVTSANDPGGPFAFQITSPRGANPVYKASEEFNVYIRVGRDAWLTCFYVDAAGAITTVLPNPLRGENPDGEKFSAGILQILPDPGRDPFKFMFTPDTVGEEVLRCFATTRNVVKDLPDSFFPGEMRPIAVKSFEEVRDAFARLASTTVVEAGITVTVKP